MSDAPAEFEDDATPAAAVTGESLIDAGDESLLSQKLLAEFFGTFLLVLFGCGSAVFATIFAIQHRQAPDLAFVTTVAFAFGISVVIGGYAFGRISGGHFNPAVSLGAALSGRLPWVTAGWYAAAQVVGGIVAAFVLWIFAHGFHGYSSTAIGIGQNSYGGPGGFAWWAAFLFELVMTAAFVTVALAATDARNRFPGLAPLTIGLTFTLIYFVGIPADGTSANPARSIGPAFFADNHAAGQLWLFILAPLIGGLIAGVAYPAVFGRDSDAVPGSGWELVVARARTVRTVRAGESAPTWQTFTAHPSHPGELPVIEQDGWRWNYETQQWVPIPIEDQPLGGQPEAESAAETTTIESAAEQTAMRPLIPGLRPTDEDEE